SRGDQAFATTASLVPRSGLRNIDMKAHEPRVGAHSRFSSPSTRRRIAWSAALTVTFASLCASAQDGADTADITKLAGFVRWGGVFLSFFMVIGAAVLLRVVTGVTERLGARFAARRMLIQKVDSFARFGVYVTTGTLILSLSLRLDSTALAVIGGALAFAVGFAMRD